MLFSQPLKHLIASLLALAAGSQCIHLIYRPMAEFPQLVEEEMARIRNKIAEEKLKAKESE